MNPFAQAAVIGAFCATAAVSTWWIAGPPQRSLPCDPATLKADEICLRSVPTDRPVVWVDARPRRDWEANGLPGSVLWNLETSEDMQAMEAEVAMQIATTPYVIVYCGDERCGTSRQIATRIRDLGMGAEVHVLHGGWRALMEAGLTRGAPSQSR